VTRLAAALGTLLVLTACAHGTTTATTSSAASGSPANTGNGPAAAPVSPVHDAGVRPAPSAVAPSSAASSTTAGHAPPRAVRKPVARSPKAAPVAVMPQILGASVSPAVVGSGSTVSATVRTTPGVVSVVAYAGGTSMAMPRVGPGLFAGSTTLPPLPPFAHGSYAVTFVARDAGGRSTQSAVGVTVR
jgi:hypothetical protein